MSVENAVQSSSGLSPQQIAGLKERLEAEHRTLVRRLALRRERLAAPFLRAPDDADWASDSADQGLLARLVDRDTKLRFEIERALARIADGTYGVCEVSGEPIGFERLSARPWARQALAAKELAERREVKVAEAVTLPPSDPESDSDDRAA